MGQQIESLEKQLPEVLTVQQQLLEKANRTCQNSSSPPSRDPPGFGKKQQKKKSNKKRGGQPGYEGKNRDLYPIEECCEVVEHHPTTCSGCGGSLTGVDENTYRHHQIVEIPPIEPIVIEHRLHQLICSQCGTSTRATLPIDVNPSGYGVRVVALVALLSGIYRNSHRMVQSALADLFTVVNSLFFFGRSIGLSVTSTTTTFQV